MRRILSIFVTTLATTFAWASGVPEKAFDLNIVNGTLLAQQRVIKVSRDETVRLRVTSDTPGNLHLHGYRMDLKLMPGKPVEYAFKAHATGRYPFEWHGAGDKAQASRHHGPEFAVIEVHPR